MSDEIEVKVHSYGAGRALSLVYFDPISGKKKAKSAKTTDWRDAERQAGELEKELRAGKYVPPSKVTWKEFRERYEAEHLASLKPKTIKIARGALNHVETHLNPDRLLKVDAGALSVFQSRLRATKIRETSIASTLRHVRAALGWAASVGMLPAVPKMVMPKGAKGRKMKGGALVTEQFERMLSAVPKVRPRDSAEWVRYLTGLWLSGLRLQESVALSWDDVATFAVDLTGRLPKFRIKGTAQKSGQDELLIMTPDFAEFLLQTPEAQRHGRVFRLDAYKTGAPLSAYSVGAMVAEMGKLAGVVVNSVDRKTASAHDLRRSFGSRWAKRVMPAVLQRLMRHASIATTMGYYVDLNVDEMADELWTKHRPAVGNTEEVGNISGNNCGNQPPNDQGTKSTSGSQDSSCANTDDMPNPLTRPIETRTEDRYSIEGCIAIDRRATQRTANPADNELVFQATNGWICGESRSLTTSEPRNGRMTMGSERDSCLFGSVVGFGYRILHARCQRDLVRDSDRYR